MTFKDLDILQEYKINERLRKGIDKSTNDYYYPYTI